MENGGGGDRDNTSKQRKQVMVVADPTRESATALRYVLSHVIIENDTLYLLHVENATFWKNKNKSRSCFKKQGSNTPAAREGGVSHGCGGGCIGGNGDFLDQMKLACERMHPKLKVKVSKVEMDAMDKAHVIISQAKKHGIDLLVVGKRQGLYNAILRQRMYGSMKGETAEYLLENSKCRCVAVQRKGITGGYLLHTKSHRNFWLLA